MLIQDLLTHCRLSDHLVLLGYGDGEMKQLDMRKPLQWYHHHTFAPLIRCHSQLTLVSSVSSVVDPCVEGIGNIEWNQRSSLLIVSGYTESGAASCNLPPFTPLVYSTHDILLVQLLGVEDVWAANRLLESHGYGI